MSYGDVNASDSYDPITGNFVESTPATIALDEGMELELSLLQQIQSRANEIHNVWSTNYLPCELNTLTEICTTAKQVVDVILVAAVAGEELGKRYAIARESAAEFVKEDCLLESCGTQTRMAMAQVRSQSWQVQGALRFEENRVDLFNKQRTNNKIAIIAPGRNGVAEAVSSLAAAAKIMAEVAAAARAAKSSDGYTAGRVFQLLKMGADALQKSGYFSPSMAQQDATMRASQEEFRQYEYNASPDYYSNSQGVSFYSPDMMGPPPSTYTQPDVGFSAYLDTSTAATPVTTTYVPISGE